MFFTKEDVSLFGENYISEGLANGTIYAIDNDTYINSEDVENALKKFKIVEVLTPNGKEYRKREIALIEKEKGSLYVVSGVFVSPEYFEKGIQDGSIIVCDICGDYEFKSESAHIETGINVCKRCARRSYAQCEDCGKWYPKSLIINVGGHKYCGGCISSHAYQCPHCGRYHLLDVPMIQLNVAIVTERLLVAVLEVTTDVTNAELLQIATTLILMVIVLLLSSMVQTKKVTTAFSTVSSSKPIRVMLASLAET